MLVVFGASYHRAELSRLQDLSTKSDLIFRSLSGLITDPNKPIVGLIMLSTCSRFELYFDVTQVHPALDVITARLAHAADIPMDVARKLFKVRVGAIVAAHLFAVTSGLNSIVVGEAQISGQVSMALRSAQLAKTTTSTLNSLFQIAAATAKKVATYTGLSAAGRSMASVAIDIAMSRLVSEYDWKGLDRSLTNSTCLIVGTGAYSRVVIAALRARNCAKLEVFSPSGRADEFATTHQIVPIPREQLIAALGRADLVVTCSGTSGNVLDVATMQRVMSQRKRALQIVDLALNSDVSAGVREMSDVDVVDLETVSRMVPPEHGKAVAAARELVTSAVAKFDISQSNRALDPAVIALRTLVSRSAEQEMSRLRAKYSEVVVGELELALHRITQALLHGPTIRARESALAGRELAYLAALKTLFGIDVVLNKEPKDDKYATLATGRASPEEKMKICETFGELRCRIYKDLPGANPTASKLYSALKSDIFT